MATRWFRDRSWWAAGAGGAVAFPIAVLLHELAHLVVYRIFGFPNLALRYAAVSWEGTGEFMRLWQAGDFEGAAAIVEPWQVATGTAAGPIVSYLLVIGCVLAVRRFGPGPFSVVLGVGLVTPLRWVGAIPILAAKARGARFTSNTDEGWVAMITGIPESILLLLGLACLLLAFWFLVAAVPRDRRMRVLVPTSGGVVLGGLLWALWLGPLVLP